MNDKRYSGPADPTTPCTECGGPTYTFASGSVWCPAEDPHPGGYFVVRVAFERSPRDEAAARERAIKPRERTGPRVRKVADIVAKVKAERKPVDPYATGMDAFVESDR